MNDNPRKGKTLWDLQDFARPRSGEGRTEGKSEGRTSLCRPEGQPQWDSGEGRAKAPRSGMMVGEAVTFDTPPSIGPLWGGTWSKGLLAHLSGLCGGINWIKKYVLLWKSRLLHL